LELVLFQPGQNKAVDRPTRSALLFDSRQRGVARWQESPMPRTRNAERGTRNRRPARIRGAHANPRFQIANLWRRQNFLWRHLQLAVGVAHRMNQSALFRVAWDDYRSRFTAFHPPVAGIQQKAPFDFLGAGAVALVTLLRQHRPDFLLEELDAFAGELFLARFDSARRGKRAQPERQNHRTNED